MEALWKLEDDWNLSTQKAIAIFACTTLLIGICVAAGAWRRRRRESVHQEPCKESAPAPAEIITPRRSVAVEVLLGSVRWSRRRSKWEESERVEERERGAPTPLLVKREVGRQSHNSTSAVWQRPILMGEKCELPRFSGLILYDQKGIPLHQCQQAIIYSQDMMPTPVVRTTLRDLL